MSDTAVLLGTEEIESIVLGAAEDEAHRLGFKLSPSAKNLLLQHSLPELERVNNEGALDARRWEVQRNTEQLIQHLVEQEIGSESATREITYQHMALGLSVICKAFPNLYPLCTKTE